LDVLYSRRAGFLKAGPAERVLGLLEKLGFELFHADLLRASAGRLEVLNGLEEFREHLGGELAITLLREIGEGFEVHEMNPDWVCQCIAELEVRYRARGKS
jgi:3-dehydroquinate synthase